MADRSVSVNLRARVGDYLAGMRKAKGETSNLGRQMTETGASADRMRKRLEAATRALPKIKIDADSSEAERKFAELRRELESLSNKKIGVDISSADARAEIQRIERDLEQLQMHEVDVDVRADIGTALAELRTVNGEVNRVDGRTARINVNADVGGALVNIGLVAAALASLPAVTSIAVGVGVLGAAFGAAGIGAAGFGAVAVPALGRINEALKQTQSAAGGAGGATRSAGQTAAQAAQQALQLEQAERRVTDAKKAAKRAEEDLTQARKDAKREIEDLNMSLKDALLDQKDAALSVDEAKANLDKVLRDPKATDLEKRRAQQDYDEAVQRLEDQKVRTKRLQDDTKAANKAGVEGSKKVRDAKDREAQADQAVIDAEKQLKVLRLQQAAALGAAGGAAGGAASKMAQLSKEERKLAADIKEFQDEYLAWQRSLEGDVFPVLSKGLKIVGDQLPRLSPLVRSTSKAFLGLEKDAERALRGPFWDEFLRDVDEQIPTAITGLGHTAGNVFTGMAGVVQAFLPYTDDVVSALEDGSERFAEWGKDLKDSPDWHAFIAFVKQEAPEVAHLLADVAVSGGHIVSALAPFGVSALSGLQLLATITRGMSPEQIRGVAIAVAAVYAAVKAGGAVNAGLTALDSLKTKIREAGDATGGTRTKLSGFMSFIGSGGPWGAAIGLGVAAVALFGDAHAEQVGKVRDMTAAIKSASGAIGEEAKQLVINQFVTDGTFDAAKKLGISLDLVTAAALGDKKAIGILNGELDKHRLNMQGASAKAGALAFAQHGLTEEANLLRGRVGESNEIVAESRKQYQYAEEAARDYNETLRDTPKAVATRVTTPGYTQSINAIDHAITQANKLERTDPKVTISANASRAYGVLNTLLRTIGASSANVSVGVLQAGADGYVTQAQGSVLSFANGTESHVAQIAPAGAMRLWAEPETGGEAYIPLAASKRARSMDILSEVADRFGQTLIPQGRYVPGGGGGGGSAWAGGGGGTSRVIVELRSDDPDLLRKIRNHVRVEGRGDVQVAFGRVN